MIQDLVAIVLMIHLFAAIMFIGGSFFLWVIVWPVSYKLTDEVVCVNVVHGLYAVGEYYRDFSQLSDEEVMGYLR